VANEQSIEVAGPERLEGSERVQATHLFALQDRRSSAAKRSRKHIVDTSAHGGQRRCCPAIYGYGYGKPCPTPFRQLELAQRVGTGDEGLERRHQKNRPGLAWPAWSGDGVSDSTKRQKSGTAAKRATSTGEEREKMTRAQVPPRRRSAGKSTARSGAYPLFPRYRRRRRKHAAGARESPNLFNQSAEPSCSRQFLVVVAIISRANFVIDNADSLAHPSNQNGWQSPLTFPPLQTLNIKIA
jgi:hypothetical protein